MRNFLYHPVSGKTNNFLLFFIALIPAFVLFSFPLSVFSSGIDSPLAWVFNFLIHGHISLGKQIIFPHGPLAFLMYPLPVGSNLWIAVTVHLAARIFLAYNLLKLSTRKPVGCLILAIISSFILLAVNDILLTLIQIIILCYLNFFERRNITWLIPALILTAFTLYIKAFVGIVSLLVTLAFAGIMIYRAIVGLESRYRLLLLLISPLVFYLIWLVLYGDFHGIGGYIQGMVQLATDNSAAVALYPINNWWWISFSFLCILVLIVINSKNNTLLRLTILAGPALFAIWKYGMSREDYLHTSMLFIFILFIALVYNIIAGNFKFLNSALSLVIVVIFYFVFQKSYYFEPFQIKTDGLQTLVLRAFKYKHFADTCNQSSNNLIVRNRLEQRILNLIGNKSVDIYPWDYSFMAANQLNWQPRPVLQSYASYTRKLDQLNARHFGAGKAPEFLIWELNKITHDIHDGRLESIDGRYLLNDEPDALVSILCNYELVDTQNGIFPVLVFKKRRECLKYESKITGHISATWNSWIDVPENKADIERASLEIQRNTIGNLKNFFYKDDAIWAYYMLENGDIRMYRIVPKNASYGLWINPLITNPLTNNGGHIVKKIMFRCSNTAMMKSEINIKWNEISFSQPNPSVVNKNIKVGLINSFFSIPNETVQPELLVSENNLETYPAFWSKPDQKKIVSTNSNRSFLLLPNEYSVTYEFPLDSLANKNSETEIIVRAGVWAKANHSAKAVFTISIEKSGQSIENKSVDIQGFILNDKEINFITNYIILSKAFFHQDGLILKVYAWNTGKESMILDDFSVRIEKR